MAVKTVRFVQAGRSWVLHLLGIWQAPSQSGIFPLVGFGLDLACWKRQFSRVLGQFGACPAPLCALCILSGCFTDSFASALQAEQLMKMSWLINLHIPPGRFNGHLSCLYGDGWPHCSNLVFWATLQVSTFLCGFVLFFSIKNKIFVLISFAVMSSVVLCVSMSLLSAQALCLSFAMPCFFLACGCWVLVSLPQRTLGYLAFFFWSIYWVKLVLMNLLARSSK